MSGSVSTASKEPPEPSAPDKTLNVLNWPVQKRKMWHGKGRLPSWVEIRKVAEDAIDDELQSHSLERLIDTIRGPCRDAGFKAGRNRRDKHAQLKRDYYNMVMGLLRAALEKRAQTEEAQAMDETVQEELRGRIPVTCSCSSDDVVVKADGDDAAAVEQGRERLTQQHGDAVEVAKDEPSPDPETDTDSEDQPQSSQNTRFYPRFFTGFFTTPAPRASNLDEPERVPTESHIATAGEMETPSLEKSVHEETEEAEGASLEDWVDVEHEMGSDWAVTSL